MALIGGMKWFNPFTEPEKILESNIQSMAAAPTPAAGVFTKVGRLPAALLGLGGGALLGGLLFGGGSQEQKQAMDIMPTVEPTQTTQVSPNLQTLMDIVTKLKQQSAVHQDVGVSDSTVGGSIASPIQTETIYNITSPTTYTHQETITESLQSTVSNVYAAQEQKATQIPDIGMIALAIAGLGVGYYILKDYL